MNDELPEDVQKLCLWVKAPERLIAHLKIVHAVAKQLIRDLRTGLPELEFDSDAILFGAATHDLGKTIHPSELIGPGSRHEEDGPALLVRLGVSADLARFARTHGTWNRERVELEDLIVALADKTWKGQRNEELEDLIATRIADKTGGDRWEVFSVLDKVATKIAKRADQRLEWQKQFKG